MKKKYQIAPALIDKAVSKAKLIFSVHTEPPKPKKVLLASFTASSGSRNVRTAKTGPKTCAKYEKLIEYALKVKKIIFCIYCKRKNIPLREHYHIFPRNKKRFENFRKKKKNSNISIFRFLFYHSMPGETSVIIVGGQ